MDLSPLFGLRLRTPRLELTGTSSPPRLTVDLYPR